METCQHWLSDSYTVSDVSFGPKNYRFVHENSQYPLRNTEEILQRLNNHGTFKHVYCRHSGLRGSVAGGRKEEGFLYYNPSSLPYNPTAPLRNTIPYVPLEISDDAVRLSRLVPAEYVNRDLRAFIEDVDRRRTPAAAAETRFLRESLGLEAIGRNLMVLGSVLEDDALSLSSDGEQGDVLLEGGMASHYPPRTLKEIYSLPHKNRGDLKEDEKVASEEVEEVVNAVPPDELSQRELDSLLTERDTTGMSDVGEEGRLERRCSFSTPSDGPRGLWSCSRCFCRTWRRRRRCRSRWRLRVRLRMFQEGAEVKEEPRRSPARGRSQRERGGGGAYKRGQRYPRKEDTRK